MTDQPTEIRRRPDGSIDTAHYLARGRLQRAEQARGMARALSPRRPLVALLRWLGGVAARPAGAPHRP